MKAPHLVFFLYTGCWPDVDADTTPYTAELHPAEFALKKPNLADGLRAVSYNIKIDLDHVAKGWGLRHYNSNSL